MMFNAYDDYQNSKRKERNMQRALPFFLVFLLLALMGWAGYRGYKSVKPKPVAVEPVVIPYTKLAAATISCNDGVMVTDWRYCQENRSEIGTGSNNIGSWGFRHANHRPRKHKLESTGTLTSNAWVRDPSAESGFSAAPYEYHSFINTIPMQVVCTRMAKFSAMDCDSRPLTPEEIDRYKPMTEKLTAPTDEVRLLVQPNERVSDAWNHSTAVKFVFTKEQASRLGNEWIKPCGLDNRDNGCWQDSKLETTPADITNLMEKISPTRRHSAQCQAWLDRNAQLGDFASKCSDWAETPTVGDWDAAYAKERQSMDPPAEPDCKMPADIDVCPAQMLDPKVKP